MAGTPSELSDRILIEQPDIELNALGGNDSVLVVASGANVGGGEGNDWLSASIFGILDEEGEDTDGDGEPDFFANSRLTTELHGNDGDDRLHASIRGEGWGGQDLIAKLHGGRGDDELWIDLIASGATFQSFVDAGSGNDTIHISTLTDATHYGSTGPVEVDAGSGDDVIDVFQDGNGTEFFGGAALATIHGGDGNDLITVFQTSYVWDTGGSENRVFGGNGADRIEAISAGGADWGDTQNYIEAGSGDDEVTATALGQGGVGATAFNEVHGDDGDDRLVLITESDDGSPPEKLTETNKAWGGTGSDVISARLTLGGGDEDVGLNEIHGDEGDDRLSANISGVSGEGSAHSELFGGTGNDRLKVSGGTDNFLTGNQGNDTLLGSTGADRMIGGQGDDYLRGYAGDDTFEFQSARDGERDRIDGFAIGDDGIDVSRIDANVFRGGNQSFSFDASGDGGTGKIWLEDYGTRSIVHADTGRAILDIVLLDGRGVDAGDYGASDFIL